MEYLIVGIMFMIGIFIGQMIIFSIVIWVKEWPGRYVQVGKGDYVKPGRFYTIRRILKAYEFWFKYDVAFWR